MRKVCIMQIMAETKSLEELMPMRGNNAYIIPEYQRYYSWGEEQIEQLFNDIQQEDPGYYVGNLLVRNHRDSESTVDVIDGQQRLITLSLFLLAVWEHATKFMDEPQKDSGKYISEEQEELIGLRRDIKRQLLLEEKSRMPRLQLLEPDSNGYQALLGVVFGERPVKIWHRTLPKRYKYISQKLFADEFRTPEELQSFYNKLNSIITLRVKVTGLEDALTVFSSFNSKGKPLTLLDLLKVEFIRAGNEYLHQDSDEVLRSWDRLMSEFSDQQGNTNDAAVTQFLLNNYDAFENDSRSSVTKGKALRYYQRLIDGKYKKGEDYLRTMVRRAQTFAQIVMPERAASEHREITERLSKLGKLESTQLYPLLFFLLENRSWLDLDAKRLSTLLDAMVAFYVRRNITLVPKSSNIRAMMLDYIREIQSKKLKGDDVVRCIVGKLGALPQINDDAVRSALLESGMYDKNKNTTRFLLIELERRLPGSDLFNKATPDNLDEYDNKTPRWTIEHILPEGANLPEWWKEAISPDDPSNAGEIQEQVVHMLGNLTLTPYNSNLKQLPFAADPPYQEGEANYVRSKRDYRRDGQFVGLRENLKLNSSLTEPRQPIDEKRDWTAADIKRRTAELADAIVELFDFPEVEAPGDSAVESHLSKVTDPKAS